MRWNLTLQKLCLHQQGHSHILHFMVILWTNKIKATWKPIIICILFCCVKDIFFSCLTDSLWLRQSQQSFNTLTAFNFLIYSLQVSAPMGHLQVRYIISYYFCFWRTILIQRIRCTYAIWYRDFICCRRFFNL
jgi:hypothetical protein